MATGDLLGVYLGDHLAGAATGVELAERLRSNNEGSPLGAVLATLVRDIEQDRAALEDLMDRLGIQRSVVKQAGGWAVEKLGRLRLSKPVTGSADLSRLLEIEALSLGIEGKLSMWRALKELAAVDARLAGTDFDGLIGRARQQRGTLEPHRLEAAKGAAAAR
jgi:hypothetical protein